SNSKTPEYETTSFQMSNEYPCFMVNNLTSTEEQCNFVTINECLEEDSFIDYGVTLLAFGNGCPDIFSSIAAASDDRPELIVSELLVLILIYIVYLIVALTGQHVLKKHRESQREKKPIKCGHPIEPSKTIREKTSSTTNDKQDYGTLDRAENRGISSTQSLGMFRISSGFGIFRYMRSFDDDDIAALASKSWHSMPAHGHFSNALRTITKSETNNNRPQQPSVSTIKVPDIERIELKDSIQSLEPITYSNVPSTALSDQDEMTITTNNTTVTQLSAKHLLNHEIYDSPSGKNTRSEVRFCKLDAHADLEDENYIKFLQSKAEIEHHLQSKLPRPSETPSLTSLNEWDDLLLHVCPIDVHNWKNFGTIDRIFEIIRAPLYFIMILTVPVVDYESRRHNWCKMLNALHCISVPVAITILTHTADVVTSVWDLPLYMLVVGPGVVAFFIVLTTSEALAIPPYHSLFAYIGFLMSILWIYSLATEVISLLKTIGVVFSMSDAAIGLGILAWGNSLGDIAANLTLAKSGYPRMALGACIGAPLLNSLLGFGLSFSLSLGPGGQTSFAYTHTLTLLYITITTILMTLMLTTLLPSNVPKKFLGYGLISLYFVYFCAAILLECGYIQ
ncbi:Mitochondrial sodium/calcium exchanger protein, partial [Fragariocoptes setiger]